MRHRRLRLPAIGLALGLTLVAPVAVPAVTGAAAACAAPSDAPHAGLVVDNGNRTTTYCVALDGQSVSGIHLIELASDQYGLQYRLGFGGKAVCQLDGVGPDGDDCFGEFPNFWGYWHGDGGTGWDWASSGAGSSGVADGEMDGWSWGTGMNGDTHAPPPALGFADVCTEGSPSPSPSPSPRPSPTHPPSPSPTPPRGDGGSGGPTTTSPAAAGSERPPSPSPRHASAGSPTPGSSASSRPATTAPPTDVVQAVAVGSSPGAGGGGPSAGALVAIAAVLALGTAGALRLRAGREHRGRRTAR